METEKTQVLLAGVGSANLTPAPGIPQGGWGAQVHQRSRGNDLPLQARALVLKAEDECMAIIDVDAIGFDVPMTDRILDATTRMTKLPREKIRLSCTHTHAGPNTFRLPMIREGLDMALSYLDSLPNLIAGAVWQAMQNLRAARVGAALGNCDINVNRRCATPDGRTFVGCNENVPADHTVTVLRFDDERGVPIAAILHYACHPTTLGWQNEFVSPDYPGQAKQVVEESLGCTCLFLQGAAGDLGPRRGFTGDRQVYRRLGTVLGLEAAKLAWNIDTLPTQLVLQRVQESGARIGIYEEVPLESLPVFLRMRSVAVDLPIRKHHDPAEAEQTAEALRRQLEETRAGENTDLIREATARATQAGMEAERARLYFGKSSIPWPVQAITIGNIALLSMAGEPFSEIGIRIREQSPFPYTLVSGYSNGGFGYIPTREAFPKGGYEVETTPFSEDAAEVLVQSALSLLQEIRHQ